MYDQDIFQYDAWHFNPALSESRTAVNFIDRIMPMTWVVVGFGNPVSLESREMCVFINDARDEIVCSEKCILALAITALEETVGS